MNDSTSAAVGVIVLALGLGATMGDAAETSAAAPFREAAEVMTGRGSAEPPAPGFHPEGLRVLHDSLRSLVEAGQIPGALLLIRRHQHETMVSAGYADIESREPLSRASIFRLASATKIWTSVALMTLVEEGRIQLDAPVATYLPEWQRLRVGGVEGGVRDAAHPLSVRDLLRHTAGLGYGFAPPYQASLMSAGLMNPGGLLGRDWTHPWTLAEWSRRLAAVPLEDEPGARFSYGLSHDVVGHLIEKVTNRRLEDVMEERVILPLRLHDTGFSVESDRIQLLTSLYAFEEGRLIRVERGVESPFRAPPAAPSGGGGWDSLGNGGMVSSAPDFARLLQMLMNGGELDGVRVLERETVGSMLTSQLAGIGAGDSFWPGAGFAFGYAVLYDGARYKGPGAHGKIWWAGSTNVHYWMDPANRLIGVLMTHVLPFGQADVMDLAERLTYQALDSPAN